jgi:hypothetical protein
MVVHRYGYFSGYQSPDGSLVPTGPMSGEGYQYTAPDGTSHQRNWSYAPDGSPTGITGHGVTGPVVHGRQAVELTVINRVNHTYSQTRTEHAVPPGQAEAPLLGLASNPSEVRQALESGQVSPQGTTTVADRAAIALPIAMPGTMPNGGTIHLTLYVDAETYQPLRTVTVVDGNPGPYVADRLPATPANIAQATDDTIPPGYIQVPRAA